MFGSIRSPNEGMGDGRALCLPSRRRASANGWALHVLAPKWPRTAESGGTWHPEHPRRFAQAGVEAGKLNFLPRHVLQSPRGRELHTVVTAQGKSVGILSGQFNKRLSYLNNDIPRPVSSQALSDHFDRIGVVGEFAGATRQGGHHLCPCNPADSNSAGRASQSLHAAARILEDVQLYQCRGVAEQDQRRSSSTI